MSVLVFLGFGVFVGDSLLKHQNPKTHSIVALHLTTTLQPCNPETPRTIDPTRAVSKTPTRHVSFWLAA